MSNPATMSGSGRRPRRQRARLWVLTTLACLLLTSSGVTAGVAASSPLGNAGVISDWTVIAQQTFLGDTTKRPQEAFLYLSFVDIAMYDAVVEIDGRYVPIMQHANPPADASDQAAAIAAAHHVLETYSPYAQATLDAAYATSKLAIPDGAAKDHGLAYGAAVADDLIAARANDGRNAAIFFTTPAAPGVWRPTPTAFLPMFVPWMGSVTPLVIKSGQQFDPGPPPPMSSKRYATDFAEVNRMGRSTGSDRTADQTSTALFFSGNAQVQYTRALVDQASRRGLDIVDSARLFAAVHTSIADALIAIWWAKLHYGFWRPVTAINLAGTDGNPATTADTTWTPLLATPPYPDYVSGYSGVTGAVSRSLQIALGTDALDLNLTSTAVSGATRHYDTAGELNRDVVDARIWLGIHFRFADTAGLKVGQHAANWVLGHAFQPVGG